jgi:hypothetical protein
MQGKACCKECRASATRLDDWTLSTHRRRAYKTSFYPVWCRWGCVVSAKVLELPARVRCDRAARELREGVTAVLKEIHRHGGDAAFHRAARDLVASVAAIVAQVEGRQRMLDVLGLIDRATEA